MSVVNGLRPHIGQARVIEGFMDSPHMYGVVVSSRQWGKSVLGQNALIYWLINNPGTEGCWISPVYAQARKVFQEICTNAPTLISTKNKSELKIDFINGSTLRFLSSERPDSIRGYSFNYMVIDEAGFVKEEAITEAILPTFTVTGKKMLVISTPKGKNWFYTWYLRGLEQNDTYISFRGVTEDNPFISKSFLENVRKSLPEGVYRQEYEGEFMDDGNDVFKNISNVTTRERTTVRKQGERYYAGVDVGVSNDYTTLVIMDGLGRVVDFYRDTNRTMEYYAREITRRLQAYGVRDTYVEVNGVGIGLYQLIVKNTKALKWTTNNQNKVQGVRHLIYDIEEENLQLPSQEWEPAFYNEFTAYTYKNLPTGQIQFNAPSGFHDDTVMATLLANEARRNFGVSGKSGLFVGRVRNV